MFNQAEIFPDYTPTSRVWIFTSPLPITIQQADDIDTLLSPFIEQWAAHGHALRASYTIEYGHFILVSVDDTAASASGCSIDKLFHAFSEIEKAVGVSLLKRDIAAYLDTNGQVVIMPFNDFKKTIQQRTLPSDTLVFNNAIDKLNILRQEWIMPLENSVYKRFIENSTPLTA